MSKRRSKDVEVDDGTESGLRKDFGKKEKRSEEGEKEGSEAGGSRLAQNRKKRERKKAAKRRKLMEAKTGGGEGGSSGGGGGTAPKSPSPAAAPAPAPSATPTKETPKKTNKNKKNNKNKNKNKDNKSNKTRPTTAPPSPASAKPSSPSLPRPKPSSTPTLSSLQSKLKRKLDGGRFRFINEQLYTQPGASSLEDFKEDPTLFEVYHAGFREQVAKWPLNPLDVIISHVKSQPRSTVVADFGCGEARLAQSVPHTVHSFDLHAANEYITACDIANVPLPDSSVDMAVFCLSLMGTNFVDFLREARRVLKPKGSLVIAEVRSRFSGVGGDGDDAMSRPGAGMGGRRGRGGRLAGRAGRGSSSKKRGGAGLTLGTAGDTVSASQAELDGIRRFITLLKSMGFTSTSQDLTNRMFALLMFTKKPAAKAQVAAVDTSVFAFKACQYKKR